MPKDKSQTLNDPENGRPWSPEGLARRSQAIAECLYLVEATPFETAMLWKTRSEQSPTRHGGRANPAPQLHDWDRGQAESMLARIADVDGRPMVLSLRREVIDGIPVCFFSVASQIADYALVDAFIKAVFPGVKKSNASNFGHFAHAVESLLAQAEALSLSRELDGSLPKGPKISRGSL